MNYMLMQGWELTLRLTMKENTEINYESKYGINYYKTGNYATRATNISIPWAKLLYIFKRAN